MYRFWSVVLFIIAGATAPFAQDAAEPFYQSIRNNDLQTLRALVKEHGKGVKDSRGQTPLMIAAAFGSVDATKLLLDSGADANAVNAAGLTALHLAVLDITKVRLLLDHGANMNVRSQMGRTPLLVAAYTYGASETVKLLASKGADVNTADATGLTPLIAAAKVNDIAAVKFLMERGADVNARANTGQAATALMGAAHNGNAEMTRLLLSRKPALDVQTAPGTGVTKNGTVQFGMATALHMASGSGNADVVKMLLEAGARVDVQDMRGMTPIMWSVSTDRPNSDVIRMLLRKGSDPSIRSKLNETTLDWVRKFNHPDVLAEFKIQAVAAGVPARPNQSELTPRKAVERSMPPLQTSAVRMLDDGGCIACHAQPVTHMAVTLAAKRGWKVGQTFERESLELLKRRWLTADQPLLQAEEAGGSLDTLNYGTLALSLAGERASWNTDVFVHYLIAKQRADGNWHGVGASRAPIQDGDISRTALSIRTLAVYGTPARRVEIDERVQRAAKWLAAQTPRSTEDRIMQLLGLKWANADSRLRETRTRELMAEQRPDGGWSQTPYLSSDAYATGQVLFTLHELGVPATNQTFKNGVQHLLQTQHDDGTWYVKSRAMKIQPYFESGFPYGHDQWISSMATAWAALALSLAE